MSLSILLYLLCLPFDPFCVSGHNSGWPGWSILLFGSLALPGSVANLAWLANPVLFSAWVVQVIGEKLPAAVLGFAALVIAVSFLFQRQVVTNEAGIPFPITCYASGYWIWLSSMVVSLFGSLATIELSPKRGDDEA